MKKLAVAAALAASCAAFAQQSQKITVTVENEIPAADAAMETSPSNAAPRKVALIVQNHAAPGADVPFMALTDALTASLAGCGLGVVNPYNSLGVNQNRTAAGEKTPEISAMELARQLGADGAVTASVLDFRESSFGSSVKLKKYSIRLSFSLADARSGAAVCGENMKVESRKYSSGHVARNKGAILDDLVHSAAEECAAKLKANPELRKWVETPAPPLPPPPPPPPPPEDPNLTISSVDSAVQLLVAEMRANPVFRVNYDKAQAAIGRAPLAIVGGLADATGGKSPCGDLASLLAAGAQTVRMTLVNSALFEAKDDAIAATVAKRIIASGNSALEDGEIMTALKEHGSPDFFIAGEMMYFTEGERGVYRLRLALHDLHTGKIVWEGVRRIVKPLVCKGE